MTAPRRSSDAADQLGFGFLDAEPSAGPPDGGPSDGSPGSPVPSGTTVRAGPQRSALVDSLRAVTLAAPYARKLLVTATRGEGRELLRALVRTGTPWVGWEVVTARPLAIECVGGRLAGRGLRVLDEFEEVSLLDDAIDAALATDEGEDREGGGVSFSDLSEALGFRRALAGAVQALRLGGVMVSDVSRAGFADQRKQGLVVRALSQYERALTRDRLADSATVLAEAASVVRTGEAALDFEHLLLVPGLGSRGRAGEFLAALLAHGAVVLETDPVVGLEVPTGWIWRARGEGSELSRLHAPGLIQGPVEGVELFCAASVEDELREVLRRVLARGLAWDEVEIVTPDAQVYGSALHALSERLDVPVTFGVGLQVARTRPGRALAACFRWIEGGFQAGEMRRLLEAGDLRPPGDDAPDGMALGRRFRELRIGWGRQRTEARLARRLAAVDRMQAREDENDDRARIGHERARAELLALAAVLRPVLEALPPLPANPLDRSGPLVSPAALATGVRRFLSLVPAHNAVDQTALERLQRVLARVEATLTRPTHYAAAAAALRSHLQIRVPAPRAEGKAPWSSDGGHLYLTDLEHGGFTGRRATFVVGLDAERFPGSDTQDPLLLDRERVRLGRGKLPTSGDRIEERRFLLAALLARLRGSVTLSWCAWEPAEARTLSASSEVLLACRLRTGDPEASFETLRGLVGTPVATIPPTGVQALDGRDVWMHALGRDGVLRNGGGTVRSGFPVLERGHRPFVALDAPVASAHLGQVEPRESLDLRRTEQVLSASRLESLGTCPRRYLYGSVLRIYPPDEPEYDPDRWLDAASRGVLLHTVYERLLREARARGIEPNTPEFSGHAQRVLADEAARMLDKVPTPSEEIHRRELAGLEDDLRAFTGMITESGRRWLDLEVSFGRGPTGPLSLPVEGGRVLVQGRIDRIDESDDGLRIIDYKTGGMFSFGAEKGVFDGARRLQHYVYWVAVRTLYGRPVAAMEYHFPTHKASNAVKEFVEPELRAAPEILGKLFDAVAGGHFLPTDEPGDCRFCDFQPVCRVSSRWNGEVDASPPAAWAARFGAEVAEYAAFRRARRREEEGPGFIQPPPLETLLGGEAP